MDSDSRAPTTAALATAPSGSPIERAGTLDESRAVLLAASTGRPSYRTVPFPPAPHRFAASRCTDRADDVSKRSVGRRTE